LTAALSIKDRLQSDVDVTVISASDQFLFNPSLIWLPFGKRTAEQITFRLEPTYTEAGVEFVHAAAEKIDPEGKKVTAKGREFDYDYPSSQPVIATTSTSFPGSARMVTPTPSPLSVTPSRRPRRGSGT
jgi:sulfide:quinone oxidoreductase